MLIWSPNAKVAIKFLAFRWSAWLPDPARPAYVWSTGCERNARQSSVLTREYAFRGFGNVIKTLRNWVSHEQCASEATEDRHAPQRCVCVCVWLRVCGLMRGWLEVGFTKPENQKCQIEWKSSLAMSDAEEVPLNVQSVRPKMLPSGKFYEIRKSFQLFQFCAKKNHFSSLYTQVNNTIP